MKKRLAIMIPLAAVVAAVMVYLLADRPWLVTNDPNTYDIRADAPVSISFDQVDKTRGVYRIVNNGSESAFCTNRFALQYQKNGDWYNVKADNSGGYLESDVGFFCFRVFEKGGCSKVLCGVFSFRDVRGKAVAVKFFVGFHRKM